MSVDMQDSSPAMVMTPGAPGPDVAGPTTTRTLAMIGCHLWSIYPLLNIHTLHHLAIENGIKWPFIVNLPIKHGDFP